MSVKITDAGSKHRYDDDPDRNIAIYKGWKYSGSNPLVTFEAGEPQHDNVEMSDVEFTNSDGDRVTIRVQSSETTAYVAAMAHNSDGVMYEEIFGGGES